MRYWLIIGVLVIGSTLGAYLAYNYGNSNLISQKTIQENCLKVLNKFMSTHPNNIHCQIIDNGYGSGGEGDTVYLYTSQDGSILRIDPAINKVTLVDKNGNNLVLPVK